MRKKWGDQWNNHAMGYLLNFGPNPTFKEALSKAKSQKCLVLGAGHETELVKKYCQDIIGVNVSREQLQSIKRYGVDVIVCDAQRLPIISCAVDLVVCKSTLHHLNDLNYSVLEIKRVAMNDAYVFLYEPGMLNFVAYLCRKFFPTDIHDPTEKPFNLNDLRSVLSNNFDIVFEKEFFLIVHVVPVLGKRFKLLTDTRLLKGICGLDALLCRTFLKKFFWIFVFTLQKK
ncbi:MAG: class I SAM-dependent methyltransferase [Candidatus Bathyarchaeia archaeon]|jgi:SAM-dependent methyltransferase